jgi:DNA primase
MLFDQDRLEKISSLSVEELYDEDDGLLVQEYLREERNLDPEILRSYEVGFCPPWVKYPHQMKMSMEGHLWYMRGRLIVTIRDLWGKILGFNGRRIDSCEEELEGWLRSQYGDEKGLDMTREWSKRKWVNESYQKSNHVYNLNRRRRDILRIGSAVVVEGCMDAIVLDAMGIHNVVSTLGTAVSDVQMSLLRRYASHIILCFDPDMSGSETTRRVLRNARESGAMTSTVIRLDGEMDPDEAIAHPRESDLLRWAISSASSASRAGDVIDLSNEGTRLAIRLLLKESRESQ